MTKPVNWRELNEELDSIVEQLQAGELDIDEAIKLHARGVKIVAELEDYLTNAKNEIEHLKK